MDPDFCVSCRFFNNLYSIAGDLIPRVYGVIGPQVSGILGAFLVVYLIWTGGRVLLTHDASPLARLPGNSVRRSTKSSRGRFGGSFFVSRSGRRYRLAERGA